jgi:AraC-like DNA-binding protein
MTKDRRRLLLGDVPILGGGLQTRHENDRGGAGAATLSVHLASATNVDQAGRAHISYRLARVDISDSEAHAELRRTRFSRQLRRALLNTTQPISKIAYDGGVSDYTHFARKIRHRFGYTPGAYSEGHDPASNGTVRASTAGVLGQTKSDIAAGSRLRDKPLSLNLS